MSNLNQRIEKYFQDVHSVTDQIDKERVQGAVEALFDAWKNKKRVFIMGNGGSAGTASHFAADLTKYPTDHLDSGVTRLQAHSLMLNESLLSSIINDVGFENLFEEQLRHVHFGGGDVLIGISVHGGHGRDRAGAWSQNLLKAIDYAKERDGVVIGLSGFDGGMLADEAHHSIVVPVRSTPLVESFHVVVHHLIIDSLRHMITEEVGEEHFVE